jgi:acetolactate synthase small subunit
MLKALTFVVFADNHPDLLARTVSLFEGMAIPIQGIAMRQPQDSSKMRMTIELLADPQQSYRIATSLAKIVHVLSINLWKQNRRATQEWKLPLAEDP